jgi:hypothetical protein
MISSNLSFPAEAGFVVAQIEIDPQPGPDGGSPMVEVAPGKTSAVILTGKVVLTKYRPRNEQIFVSLRAHTEDWGAEVLPMELTINPNEWEYPIQISVAAPPWEDVNEERTVIIDGDWIANPSQISGNVKPNGVHVRVAPFIKFFANIGDGYKRVWPGGKADFSMNVHNLGNRNESFHISVNDLESLEQAGFAFKIPTEYISVDSKAKGIFRFSVEGTAKNFHPWRTHLTTISLHIVPTTEVPIGNPDPEYYSWNVFFFYYERGPSFPEPCIFSIIIGIVFLVAIYYTLKKRSQKRRKIRKLLRQKRRQKKRQEEES